MRKGPKNEVLRYTNAHLPLLPQGKRPTPNPAVTHPLGGGDFVYAQAWAETIAFDQDQEKSSMG